MDFRTRSAVRKPNGSAETSPSLIFRTDVQCVQMPAKKASDRYSSNAGQTGCLEPPTGESFSKKAGEGPQTTVTRFEPLATGVRPISTPSYSIAAGPLP